MSLQSIVPISINGESFYTHTSWFSEKQYNGWSSIPAENKNLAFYYSLSTISLIGIVIFLLFSSSEEPPSSNRWRPAMEDSWLEWVQFLRAAISDGLDYSSHRKVQSTRD